MVYLGSLSPAINDFCCRPQFLLNHFSFNYLHTCTVGAHVYRLFTLICRSTNSTRELAGLRSHGWFHTCNPQKDTLSVDSLHVPTTAELISDTSEVPSHYYYYGSVLMKTRTCKIGTISFTGTVPSDRCSSLNDLDRSAPSRV